MPATPRLLSLFLPSWVVRFPSEEHTQPSHSHRGPVPTRGSQALIAGGTFNGELYVWDLSLEGDPQRGRSDVLLDVRHMEPILNITWQYNLTGRGAVRT